MTSIEARKITNQSIPRREINWLTELVEREALRGNSSCRLEYKDFVGMTDEKIYLIMSHFSNPPNNFNVRRNNAGDIVLAW